MNTKRRLTTRSWLPVLLLFVAIAAPACTTTGTLIDSDYRDWQSLHPPPDDSLTNRIFLIGDTGYASDDSLHPALTLLESQLAAADSTDMVVFLGDNIYCCGLREPTDPGRAEDERRIDVQLDVLSRFPGRALFIPGNHDWDDAGPNGLNAIRREADYIESRLGYDAFLPDNGFPGPVEIELSDRIFVVPIDTQWWLQKRNKPYGDTGEYDLDEDADFLIQIEDIIRRRDDEILVFVGHHPIESEGEHAGAVPLKNHLFPLRRLNSALWIPLPLLGSVYPLTSRRFLGGRQDLGHPRYRSLRRALKLLFERHEHLIYASGHDHSLQYFEAGPGQHYIISGSGSRPHPVSSGSEAIFTHGGWGHSVLNIYEDGSVWMEMWKPVDNGRSGKLLFRDEINGAFRELVDPQLPDTAVTTDYADSTVVMAIDPSLAAGGLKAVLFGSHHRDLWATPVRAPVLDLGAKAGGLKPVKLGGGQQTVSLRLENEDGLQYVLRSIDKEVNRSLPDELRGTLAADVVEDQLASLHPFGAFIIPPLADAAGIYHTNPELVYVPHDSRLGAYEDVFAGRLMLLEERPDDDMTSWPTSGSSEDVESTATMYEKVEDDNDHRVDQRFFARSRLFDMWISDWDRHADQWRWASFEPYELHPQLEGEARTDGKIYRPIPRDRDWAFFHIDGLFPSILKRRFFFPKYQDFRSDYGYIKGLLINGLPLSRRFLNELTRTDFVEIADSLETALSDEVIREAVGSWPSPVFEKDGANTIEILQNRRDQLSAVAEAVYEILAKVVDVVGSDDHEVFEILRRADGTTEVTVYNANKEGERRKVFYRRLFLPVETKQLRLFGLGGNDHFEFDGEASGIDVIVVGGEGNDVFVDKAGADGSSDDVKVYDSNTGSRVDLGPGARVRLDDVDPLVNRYDPAEYHFGRNLPLANIGYNETDGLVLTGGARLTRQAFRKSPFAAQHDLTATASTYTGGLALRYDGHLTDVIGRWDLEILSSFRSRQNTLNFYGLGNETAPPTAEGRYYQARYARMDVSTNLLLETFNGAEVRVGPQLEYINVRNEPDRFLAQQPGVSGDVFAAQWFGGVGSRITIEAVDRPHNPLHGYRWRASGVLDIGLRHLSDTHARLGMGASLYVSPSVSPQITVALNLGAESTIGAFPFYRANTLGDSNHLRGYRSSRFAGRTAVYQNIEIRAELVRFRTNLAVGRAGLFLFLDNGRVWTEADDSRNVSQSLVRGYHQGYGAGVWFDLFDYVLLQGGAGFSTEGATVTAGLGFAF
ncbi:MAG: metallophosphoesterase [Rhodothermales bacterium]